MPQSPPPMYTVCLTKSPALQRVAVDLYISLAAKKRNAKTYRTHHLSAIEVLLSRH
uniref:Uncharacterized protein n=1 Tax=Arundo donax TaxID=35708 RepID=A0A0A9GAE5_ARUDO